MRAPVAVFAVGRGPRLLPYPSSPPLLPHVPPLLLAPQHLFRHHDPLPPAPPPRLFIVPDHIFFDPLPPNHRLPLHHRFNLPPPLPPLLPRLPRQQICRLPRPKQGVQHLVEARLHHLVQDVLAKGALRRWHGGQLVAAPALVARPLRERGAARRRRGRGARGRVRRRVGRRGGQGPSEGSWKRRADAVDVGFVVAVVVREVEADLGRRTRARRRAFNAIVMRTFGLLLPCSGCCVRAVPVWLTSLLPTLAIVSVPVPLALQLLQQLSQPGPFLLVGI
ncbi:hypothetical protein BDY21DRAFT_354441 [Lineolata rhizophorae]|uniref:Uncharacterized protein n=1 Tax=Lineolata rhizophorae TaxID=578093 RepID=A0A6A6NRF4_9PEZI|nr:hypothetical protein BDY21DRAFT_354441 [Lineolata rhizophorae]